MKIKKPAIKKVEKDRAQCYLPIDDIELIKKYGGGKFMTGISRLIAAVREDLKKEVEKGKAA